MYNDPFLRWSCRKVNPRKGLRDLPSFDYTLGNVNETEIRIYNYLYFLEMT